MSKEAYLLQLRGRLSVIDEKISRVRRKQEQGAPIDRIHAAGDLAVLQRRRDEVERKIAEVRASAPSRYDGLRGEIIEDLDAIGSELDRLISGV